MVENGILSWLEFFCTVKEEQQSTCGN